MIPLILLGSNLNIYKLVELCESANFSISGIIDDDYYEQGSFENIPIINKEQDLINNTSFFQKNYQFICATNWIPGEQNKRNKEKRDKLISMIDNLSLPVATIVSPQAQVSQYSKIGKGVIIDSFAVIEPNTVIGDYCSFYTGSYLGHHSKIDKNCVIQRYAFITSNVQIEDNVYCGIKSSILDSYSTIKSGTVIHPGIQLLRGTTVNEIVSLAGKDLRKVYNNTRIN